MANKKDQEIDLRTKPAPFMMIGEDNPPPTKAKIRNLPPPDPPRPSKRKIKQTREEQMKAALTKLDEFDHQNKMHGAQKIIDKAAGIHKPSENGGLKRDGTPDKRASMPHRFKKGDPRTIELASKGGRAGKIPKFRQELEKLLEKEAREFIRPYREAMALREDDSWSPSTKLKFFFQQTEIAEKAFDRIEGKPVNRNRSVDKEDNDITSESVGAINKDAAVNVLVGIFGAIDKKEVAPDIIEGSAQ